MTNIAENCNQMLKNKKWGKPVDKIRSRDYKTRVESEEKFFKDDQEKRN